MSLYLNAILPITFILSCTLITTKPKVISFTFDGQSSVLPSSVKELQDKNGYKYFIYRGFRGQSLNYTTVLQLDKTPLWVGSENVDEKFYANKKVVGITFIQPSIKSDIKKVQAEIEDEYKQKFTSIKNTSYQKLTTAQGLVIVISKKRENNYISFYVDLSNGELEEYIRNIW